jgi:hypothetical protein
MRIAVASGRMLSWFTYDADQRQSASQHSTWDGAVYTTIDQHGTDYLKDGRLSDQVVNVNSATSAKYSVLPSPLRL